MVKSQPSQPLLGGDAGGNGDCGYRALAVAYALQDARSVEDALKAAKPIGATLRAQITSHISKHHFEEFFDGLLNSKADQYQPLILNGWKPLPAQTGGLTAHVFPLLPPSCVVTLPFGSGKMANGASRP